MTAAQCISSVMPKTWPLHEQIYFNCLQASGPKLTANNTFATLAEDFPSSFCDIYAVYDTEDHRGRNRGQEGLQPPNF